MKLLYSKQACDCSRVLAAVLAMGGSMGCTSAPDGTVDDVQVQSQALVAPSLAATSPGLTGVVTSQPVLPSLGARAVALRARDGVRATKSAAPLAGQAPSRRIAGIDMDESGDLTGFIQVPPDPIAAAGRAHVVTMVNTVIAWTTKVGTFRHVESLGTFFAPLHPVDSALFDPKVVYDQYSDRFVALVLERVADGAPPPAVSPGNTSRVLIAVSNGGDPNNGWNFQAIDSKEVVGGADAWADFPGLAVDARAVYVTNNLFAFATGVFQGSRLWIVDKAGLYDGATGAATSYDPPGVTGAVASTEQPAHVFGVSPAGLGTFLVSGGLSAGTDEVLSVIRVDDPLGAPSFHQNYVLVGNIDDNAVRNMPGAPQAGTPRTIVTNDRRVLQAVWRNEHLYATAEVLPPAGTDAGQVTAHWFRLAATSPGAPALEEQGNVGGEDLGAGTFTYFPGISVDGAGDVAIGFSASSPTLFPGAYYAGRLSGDAPGTVRATQVLQAGADYYARELGPSGNRWGDFSGLSVDPNDDATFWAYNEWAETRGSVLPGFPDQDGRWGTTLGSFQYTEGTVTTTSRVGDIDNFTPGNSDDVSPKSEVVLATYKRIADTPDSGQNTPENLDAGGDNRPVGLTHYFAIPPDALVTSAHLKFHVRGTNDLFYNDVILLEDTAFPIVTFYDLLGIEPQFGTDYTIDVDLGRVPVRTGGDQGPGGHWPSADPTFLQYQDLRSGLLDGQLDLVFADDSIVDYSLLSVTYATRPNTGVGTGVSVSPASGVNVTFSTVLTAGHTTVATGITPTLPLPAGYALGSTGAEAKPTSVYDVQSTATVEGAETVTINDAPELFQHPENVRLLHLEGDHYVDRTTMNDVVNHVVTAQVASLSEFVVAEYTGAFMSSLDVPFALIEFKKHAGDGFQVTQAFTLNASTNGIDPAGEPFEITFGLYDELLPAGSFKAVSFGMGYRAEGKVRIWEYSNPKADGLVAAVIVLLDSRHGFVSYTGRDVDLDATRASQTPSALPFTLRIGDDYGIGRGRLVAHGSIWLTAFKPQH